MADKARPFWTTPRIAGMAVALAGNVSISWRMGAPISRWLLSAVISAVGMILAFEFQDMRAALRRLEAERDDPDRFVIRMSESLKDASKAPPPTGGLRGL